MPKWIGKLRHSEHPPLGVHQFCLGSQFVDKLWPALSTFTNTDGVEPTNNHAERGLRGAVIYHKLSLSEGAGVTRETCVRLQDVGARS